MGLPSQPSPPSNEAVPLQVIQHTAKEEVLMSSGCTSWFTVHHGVCKATGAGRNRSATSSSCSWSHCSHFRQAVGFPWHLHGAFACGNAACRDQGVQPTLKFITTLRTSCGQSVRTWLRVTFFIRKLTGPNQDLLMAKAVCQM